MTHIPIVSYTFKNKYILQIADTSLVLACKPKYSKKQRFLSPEVNIQIKNGHRVFSRLVLCLKCMKLDCQVLHGHFGSVHLLQVSENGDKKGCF